MGNKVESAPGVYPEGVGSLYSLDSNLHLQEHIENVSISNGLAWSSDSKIMYYIDTMPKKLYAFDYDNNMGKISKSSIHFHLPTHSVSHTPPSLAYFLTH